MKRLPIATWVGVSLLALAANPAWAGPIDFTQMNLVSDIPGLAVITDASLRNPWGMSFSPTSPFWISDQGTSDATLYTVTITGVTKVGLTVSIPTTAAGPQGPTGQTFNSFNGTNPSAFQVGGRPATFMFANLNGTISAWNGGTTATVVVPSTGVVYTGLAVGGSTSTPMLYAARAGGIDVFDGSFSPVALGPGAFVDPAATAAGLVPFNVQNIGGNIYVTYAPATRAGQTGATLGQGAVAAFHPDGTAINNNLLAPGGELASPWGMAVAPAGFGSFGGDLLVGNFSYALSEINAFDPTTGAFLGTILDDHGNPIINSGLWDLTFGNGGNGGLADVLYFTAGINGEADGLFGAIAPSASAVPEPATLMLLGMGLVGIARRRRRGPAR